VSPTILIEIAYLFLLASIVALSFPQVRTKVAQIVRARLQKRKEA
jgi:hypothetical protein